MRHWFLPALIGLALVAPAMAADPAPDEEAVKAIQETQEGLNAKLTEIRNNYQKLAKEGADKKELATIVEEFNKTREEGFAKLAELAAKAPASDEAFGILAQVVAGGGEGSEKAADLLSEHHAAKPTIGRNALRFAQSTSPHAGKFLAAIREKNENEESLAFATLGLGMWHRGQVKASTGEEQDKHLADAKKFLAEAGEKYGDVELGGGNTIGKIASGQVAGLEMIAKLAVGKEVPEIDGEDTDGKSFKLSDYRGKVVLLDYWAFW